MKDVRLFIAVSSCRDWKPHFASAFTELICYTSRNGLNGRLTEITIGPAVNQSNLSASRQKLLDQAIDGGFSHIVMLDDDMMFPADMIEKFLAHDKDLVCANVCQKVPDKINGVCLDFKGQRINSTHKSGLEKIGFGTLAVTLLKLDVLKNIPRPHFEVIWRPEMKDYQGEDHYFFHKLGKAGVEFWCDHDVTQEVKHIGDYPYQFPQKQSAIRMVS